MADSPVEAHLEADFHARILAALMALQGKVDASVTGSAAEIEGVNAAIADLKAQLAELAARPAGNGHGPFGGKLVAGNQIEVGGFRIDTHGNVSQ